MVEIAIVTVLVDLNLAVQFGITIHIIRKQGISVNFKLEVARIDHQTPKFNSRAISTCTGTYTWLCLVIVCLSELTLGYTVRVHDSSRLSLIWMRALTHHLCLC